MKMVVLHRKLLHLLDGLPDGNNFTLPALKEKSLKIEFSDVKSAALNDKPVYSSSKPPPLPFADSELFHASIVLQRRLTALDEDCKDVYEITFNVEGSQLHFKAGDTIGVIPQNQESEVNFILSHLDVTSKADTCYSLYADTSVKGNSIPIYVPVKSTLRHVLTNCLDLRSLMKKLFLLALSKYTKDKRERKTLEYLCSKEGSASYTSHILNEGLCILDILTIFTSCKPHIEVLLANLPRLLPRPYSIVNSGLKNNEQITICFSVMTVNNRKGLTTGWLENKILNDESLECRLQNLNLSKEDNSNEVQIYLRKNMNTFYLPEKLETPIILIGPGTGVAPFIGFLEEKEWLKNSNTDMKLGETWLFFGCRNPSTDFLYEDKLNEFLSKGILSHLSTAFSRINEADCKHIQDMLRENGENITRLINNDAIIYICGDAKSLATEVIEVITKCIVEHENVTMEDAKLRILNMQKSKRILVDAWS